MPICRFYFISSSYVVFKTFRIALSCDACICCIPLSIFTSASLVISTFCNCINVTISVCRIPFSFLIRLMFFPINISSCFIFCSILSPYPWTHFSPFYGIVFNKAIDRGLILVHFMLFYNRKRQKVILSLLKCIFTAIIYLLCPDR